MTNLTKEQLLEKDEAGLQDIAQQLNVKDIIYLVRQGL